VRGMDDVNACGVISGCLVFHGGVGPGVETGGRAGVIEKI